MQKLIIYIVSFALALTVNSNRASAAKVYPPRYRKVVLVKPARPHIKVHKPSHIKNGYVWVEGHWQWHKRAHKYVWVKAHLVKRKNGKVWISGYWKPVKGGWLYRPGKWA